MITMVKIGHSVPDFKAKATASVDWSKESTNTKLISATYRAG